MGIDQQSHRPGLLKQKNKSHKTGRHRSKGAVDNDLKGRSSVKTITKKNKSVMRREQRRHQANQLRKNKREDAIAKKRALGAAGSAPFLVCLLPLNADIDPNSALDMLEKCDPEAIVDKSLAGVTYITIPRFKQRFSFVIPPIGRGKELTTLDYLKVCDTTILLISAATDEDDILDKWGQRVFNMAMAQGIPTPIVSVMDLESIVPKRKQQTKTAMQKMISKIIPDEKIMTLDTNSDAFNVLRRIGGQKKNIQHNKANRPHLFAENVEYINETKTLKVTGFLRGVPLDVNQLVHIPGLGDFQMTQIDAPNDPHKFDKKNTLNEGSISTELRILAKADPSKQITLQKENIPDEMDAEQTWPTEEEIAALKEENKKKLIKRIPKGMSDYQACWIPDVEEKDDEDVDEDDDEDDNDSEDDEFMSCADSDEEMKNKDSEDQPEEEFDTVTVSEAPVNDEKYDQEMDFLEEKSSLQKIKEAKTDQQWPDELDTPLDIPARERFQKYRGLESFRTSPWDSKENLPIDYARIFQFKNFDRTKRRIIKEAADIEDGVQTGWYITIHVANVSQELWKAYSSGQSSSNLIVYGMLPHEHQMSVINVVLKRTPDSEVPIKSKERMIVQCGYRRFIVNPIFSQHTNSDRHKFERFFRPNETVVATFYAPIQFPPAPVLCFRENPDTTLTLTATGILLSANPDRIVLKRIALSGHPFKINRRVATIRYMFFNKDDVEYFNPVKLRTKCGRMGHIKESLGTHGHMKCVFDGQLKSFDTVLMNLYKRVFPKWTYEDCIVSCPPDETAKMQE